MEDFRIKGTDALKIVFTKEQNINTFEKYIYEISLKYLKKYEKIEDIYTLNIYQIINEIMKDKSIPLPDLLKKIKNGNIYWKHPFYKEYISKEAEQENFLIKPFEIEEGVLTCKCGSKKVFSYQRQQRSADEPMSTFATCTACGSKWIYSG